MGKFQHTVVLTVSGGHKSVNHYLSRFIHLNYISLANATADKHKAESSSTLRCCNKTSQVYMNAECKDRTVEYFSRKGRNSECVFNSSKIMQRAAFIITVLLFVVFFGSSFCSFPFSVVLKQKKTQNLVLSRITRWQWWSSLSSSCPWPYRAHSREHPSSHIPLLKCMPCFWKNCFAKTLTAN